MTESAVLISPEELEWLFAELAKLEKALDACMDKLDQHTNATTWITPDKGEVA